MHKFNRATLALASLAILFTTSALALTQEETELSVLVNKFRTSLGLSYLEIHPALQNAAASHSEWMSITGILQHNGPYSNTTFAQRIQTAGFEKYTILAENIACGYPDAYRTFMQWIYSTPHLNNILNPRFHYMGISRAGHSNQPCPFFWTNDFGSDKPSSGFIPLTAGQIQQAIEAIKNEKSSF